MCVCEKPLIYEMATILNIILQKTNKYKGRQTFSQALFCCSHFWEKALGKSRFVWAHNT